ncbi:hypothetical protein [Pseudoxanthomonas dokdonensis]|uniref:Metallo-beta-lactamase domain-containing protein n=1 Tax=Pseudoxanthomonas dokdonensis TaxID=344882 RepID=A0A0R0D115_9GAMM|nr:hypothetical protein [Pseudoxanthomonas dokdonensis]KRG71700.1 hypothetical protein ABB29_02895 [Pseudoxanthomonas dokdonensis]
MQQLADHFWNLRGPQRVAGILNVGTHMSAVRRVDGRFVLVDGAPLDDDGRAALLALTDGGALVDAVIHVHPFHTLHVEALHRLLPAARLHGTARHRQRLPSLPWAGEPLEHWGDDHLLADTFDFSVPDGVDFVCPDERVHVASVLVRHRASGIVHVDDTLNVLAAPGVLKRVLPQSALRMHPMLGKALSHRAGAADAYAAWARDLAHRWSDTRLVCAAHSAVRELPPGGFSREVEAALAKVAHTLEHHRRRFS